MRLLKYLSWLILILCLGSCKQGSVSKNDTKVISVSILPQKYIVSQIAGDKISINVLVPEDANHETYEPTASQMVETGKSLAYFKLGYLDFENSWLGKLTESNPGMEVFDTSEGINLISGEEHGHGGHIHQSGIDPHIWLSVSDVKQQANNILKGLSQIDPKNSTYYNSNYNRFLVSLDSLDQDIREIFDSLPSRSFMIFHPSLAYFARDYGLEQIAIEQEGKDPSPVYMKQLIDLAKEKGIHTIFVSSQFSKQSALAIARQINARVEEFNPSAADWPENMRSISTKLAASTQTNN